MQSLLPISESLLKNAHLLGLDVPEPPDESYGPPKQKQIAAYNAQVEALRQKCEELGDEELRSFNHRKARGRKKAPVPPATKAVVPKQSVGLKRNRDVSSAEIDSEDSAALPAAPTSRLFRGNSAQAPAERRTAGVDSVESESDDEAAPTIPKSRGVGSQQDLGNMYDHYGTWEPEDTDIGAVDQYEDDMPDVEEDGSVSESTPLATAAPMRQASSTSGSAPPKRAKVPNATLDEEERIWTMLLAARDCCAMSDQERRNNVLFSIAFRLIHNNKISTSQLEVDTTFWKNFIIAMQAFYTHHKYGVFRFNEKYMKSYFKAKKKSFSVRGPAEPHDHISRHVTCALLLQDVNKQREATGNNPWDPNIIPRPYRNKKKVWQMVLDYFATGGVESAATVRSHSVFPSDRTWGAHKPATPASKAPAATNTIASAPGRGTLAAMVARAHGDTSPTESEVSKKSQKSRTSRATTEESHAKATEEARAFSETMMMQMQLREQQQEERRREREEERRWEREEQWKRDREEREAKEARDREERALERAAREARDERNFLMLLAAITGKTLPLPGITTPP
jgi:hypothetical protein